MQGIFGERERAHNVCLHEPSYNLHLGTTGIGSSTASVSTEECSECCRMDESSVAPARQPLLIKIEPTYSCRLHASMKCSRSLTKIAWHSFYLCFLLQCVRAHVAHARTWTRRSPFHLTTFRNGLGPWERQDQGNSHLRMIIGAASTTCDSYRGRKQA